MFCIHFLLTFGPRVVHLELAIWHVFQGRAEILLWGTCCWSKCFWAGILCKYSYLYVRFIHTWYWVACKINCNCRNTLAFVLLLLQKHLIFFSGSWEVKLFSCYYLEQLSLYSELRRNYKSFQIWYSEDWVVSRIWFRHPQINMEVKLIIVINILPP